MVLLSEDNLESYFDPQLQRALDAQGVHADDHVRHYLLRLLVHHASEATGEPSLVDLELEARTCAPAQRGRALRRLGDHALFTTGLFGERLHKRGISTRYYCDKGQSAYAEAADASRPQDRALAPAVRALARRFGDFVCVLRHFRSRTALSEAPDAGLLLERQPMWQAHCWQPHGSSRSSH